MELERLDKLVSVSMAVSRTDAKLLIKKGCITVDSIIISDPSQKVDTKAVIKLDGKELTYKKYVYYMLNKPSGVLSASNDKTRETVVDIISNETGRKGLFPVGRLDKDTTGLLIVTDDGDYGHRVITPKNYIEKEYIVTVDKQITEKDIEFLAGGVTLADGTKCRPAKVTVISDDKKTLSVIITEGKYHEIKRILGTVNVGVITLHRKRIGQLLLDSSLCEGQYRELELSELEFALS
jgi:16S rRNA pseudouridine516 synthase